MQEVLPILVFQTDFTYKEGAVAAMYGVVRSVDRDVEIITATHEIPQYDLCFISLGGFLSNSDICFGFMFLSLCRLLEADSQSVTPTLSRRITGHLHT